MAIPTEPICNYPTCGKEIFDETIIVAKLKKNPPTER